MKGSDKKADHYEPMPRIRNLSGLKFWWILLIMFCHFFAVLKYCTEAFANIPVFLTNGHFSAFGFLTLAGFFMYLRHRKDYSEGNPLAKSFALWAKGFLRFFLLNLLTMIPYVVVDVLDGKLRLKYIIMVFMNLFFVQDWFPGRHYSLNGVSWFLSSLMMIYLFVPFLFLFYRFLRKKLGPACVIAVAGLLLFALLGAESFFSFDFYRNPLFSLLAFAVGMVLADAALLIRPESVKKSGAGAGGNVNPSLSDNVTVNKLLLRLMAILLIALGFVYTPAKMPYLWDTAISCAVILCLYLSADGVPFSGRMVMKGGEISLSVMLIHYMICSLPFKWLIENCPLPALTQFVLMLFCMLLSFALAYGYEWLRRLVRRERK